MSGIVGIVNFDGTAVDARLLRQMTDSLAYRGPDKSSIWVDGPVGFGHTLLSTTREVEHDDQPASLDGRAWISADARLDDRAVLVEKLKQKGFTRIQAATDAQLILHAYDVWGEGAVEHLLGDFAFAIWDGRRRCVFCTRDHFGIKPFYYAVIQGGIVFSNTLDCVRSHPRVGNALNDLAIGDFLLFGCNQELTTTTFAAIHRLPPAHTLTCGDGTLRIKRYWALPTAGQIRYRQSQDYVDHFREILRAAVSDRIRNSDIGISMSGGLDSTSITAIAQQVRRERGSPFALRAHTIVYDALIPDHERHYARMAAEALGVDVDYFAADNCAPFDGWDRTDFRTPEPTDDLFQIVCTRQLEQAASHSRVLLSGEGGDEVLWTSYVVDLLGKASPIELITGIAQTVLLQRRRPGFGIRSYLKRQFRKHAGVPPYPVWMNNSFTDRLNLRARWVQWNSAVSGSDHRLRAEAHQRLATAPWSWYFETSDPGMTHVPVEWRYPFLDLRVIDFLFAIPPLPWCVDKQLLRLAMRGALPDPIRLRRKAPLAGDPLRVRLQRPGLEWLDSFEPTPALVQYVNRTDIPHLAGGCEYTDDPGLHLRPLCLNHWLIRSSVVYHEEEIGR